MVETFIKLITNLEEGWLYHFKYDVLPIRKICPKLFPYALIAFANHPRWFIDNKDKIYRIVNNYDKVAMVIN